MAGLAVQHRMISYCFKPSLSLKTSRRIIHEQFKCVDIPQGLPALHHPYQYEKDCHFLHWRGRETVCMKREHIMSAENCSLLNVLIQIQTTLIRKRIFLFFPPRGLERKLLRNLPSSFLHSTRDLFGRLLHQLSAGRTEAGAQRHDQEKRNKKRRSAMQQ